MKGWRAAWCLRKRDTVSRWIALTTILAMLTSLGFYALFTQVAGVWAYPPLTETGLLEKLSSLSRVIAASEPAQRQRLADAASDSSLTIRWSASHEALELPDTPDAASRADKPTKHLLSPALRRWR